MKKHSLCVFKCLCCYCVSALLLLLRFLLSFAVTLPSQLKLVCCC